jgi:hypothetical protein
MRTLLLKRVRAPQQLYQPTVLPLCHHFFNPLAHPLRRLPFVLLKQYL